MFRIQMKYEHTSPNLPRRETEPILSDYRSGSLLRRNAESLYNYTKTVLIRQYVFYSASVRRDVSAVDRLGVIEINTEPLDAGIERRLKQFWENTSCPRCGVVLT
jgi:hypothetical protein